MESGQDSEPAKGSWPDPSVPAVQYFAAPGVQFTQHSVGVNPGQPQVPGVQPVIYQYAAQPQIRTVAISQPKPTDVSGQMQCPHCGNVGMTVVTYKSGLLTWLICGGVFLFLLWPCSCIPFCVNACKDVEHSCPTCHNVIHIHKRIS